MRKRIAYAQNFLKSRGLVSRLLEESSITKKDTVYEMGAGSGVITKELLRRAGSVVAFELDHNLFNKLALRFKGQKGLKLRHENFLESALPNYPYKVFSNIPFSTTADVVKKLLLTVSPPLDSYLILQREAAEKFAGIPYARKNSLLATILYPWFETSIFYRFKPNDFFPKPGVETVLLRIEKRENPKLSQKDKRLYEDFVTFAFNQFKPNITEGLKDIFDKEVFLKLSKEIGFSKSAKPSELKQEEWLSLFIFFKDKIDRRKQTKVWGAYEKMQENQQGIRKIHRTRLDKDWKSK